MGSRGTNAKKQVSVRMELAPCVLPESEDRFIMLVLKRATEAYVSVL